MLNFAIVSSRNSVLPYHVVLVKHFLFIVRLILIFLYSMTRISQVPKHFLL